MRHTVEANVAPVLGRDAYLAYAQSLMPRYPGQRYADLLTYALPKGIAARFVSHRTSADAQAQSVACGQSSASLAIRSPGWRRGRAAWEPLRRGERLRFPSMYTTADARRNQQR